MIWHLYWIVCLWAIGACIGSFLNVVVYRLPRGKSLWRSGSACPVCDHKLSAYDNVPVLGWMWLRGKCRHCKTVISAEYPAVESVTAWLFVAAYAVYYLTPLRPAFGDAGFESTWPIFAVHLGLIALLVPIILIDTELAIIPGPLTSWPVLVVLVAMPFAANHFGHLPASLMPASHEWQAPKWLAPAQEPFIPHVNSWGGICVALSGMLGVLISAVMVRTGILPDGFAAERAMLAEMAEKAKQEGGGTISEPPVTSVPWSGHVLWRGLMAVGAVWGGALALGHLLAWEPATSMGIALALASLAAVLVLILAKAFSLRISPTDPDQLMTPPDPRKMAGCELFFVIMVVALTMGGTWLALHWVPDTAPPMSLRVAAGVLQGYLMGGAVCWMIRILGTFAFRKEALGFGDVHLMALVGAFLGGNAALVVFPFLGAFVGLVGAILFLLATRWRCKKDASHDGSSSLAVPLGPWLAMATLLVQFFGIERVDKFELLVTLHTIFPRVFEW